LITAPDSQPCPIRHSPPPVGGQHRTLECSGGCLGGALSAFVCQQCGDLARDSGGHERRAVFDQRLTSIHNRTDTFLMAIILHVAEFGNLALLFQRRNAQAHHPKSFTAHFGHGNTQRFEFSVGRESLCQ